MGYEHLGRQDASTDQDELFKVDERAFWSEDGPLWRGLGMVGGATIPGAYATGLIHAAPAGLARDTFYDVQSVILSLDELDGCYYRWDLVSCYSSQHSDEYVQVWTVEPNRLLRRLYSLAHRSQSQRCDRAFRSELCWHRARGLSKYLLSFLSMAHSSRC